MDQGLQYFKETLSAMNFRARLSAFSFLPISMKRLHSHNQFDTQDSPNTWGDFRSLILLQLCIQQYKLSSILYKGQCIVELFLNRVRHNMASCRSFIKNSEFRNTFITLMMHRRLKQHSKIVTAEQKQGTLFAFFHVSIVDPYKTNLKIPRWFYRSVAQIWNTLMQHHLYAPLQHILMPASTTACHFKSQINWF